MARASSDDVIVLGARRRERLEAIVARETAPQRLVRRAKIVLAAWRGEATASIARELGICVDTVGTWRGRFRREGMPGLLDRSRSGRPPVYGIEDQLLIVATVTGQTPRTESHWTHRALAEYLREPLGICASQIGWILASLDLKAHRVRGWLNRRQPTVSHQSPRRVPPLPRPAARHGAVQRGREDRHARQVP